MPTSHARRRLGSPSSHGGGEEQIPTRGKKAGRKGERRWNRFLSIFFTPPPPLPPARGGGGALGSGYRHRSPPPSFRQRTAQTGPARCVRARFGLSRDWDGPYGRDTCHRFSKGLFFKKGEVQTKDPRPSLAPSAAPPAEVRAVEASPSPPSGRRGQRRPRLRRGTADVRETWRTLADKNIYI